MSSEPIYNETYFAYQRGMGNFGGWAELSKFVPYLDETDAVLDFGCGGGFLLHNLKNPIKAGLEINPQARTVCEQFGLTVYASKSAVPDVTFNAIISNHALEHCVSPLDEIVGLKGKLKPNGRMIFFVPSESSHIGYYPGNPDHHLYTWSPMNLGNLFDQAGLKVLSAGPYHHRWPPFYETIARLLGRRGFELSCRIYGLYKRNLISQSYCLARLE